MKRRVDYILEKVNFNSKNQAHANNNTETSQNYQDNCVRMTDTNKENNILPFNSSCEEYPDKLSFNQMDQIVAEVIPETNNKSLTDSPSIIENSPNRSIPYFDPKVLCVVDTNKLQTKMQIQEFTIVLEPEFNNSEQSHVPNNEKEYPPSKKSYRDSSTSSDSTTSSSSRSSSSSSSSSDAHTNFYKNISNTNLSIDGPSTSNLTGQVTRKNTKNYHQSPIHSNESDVDLSDTDPTYTLDSSRSRRTTRLSSSSSSSSANTALELTKTSETTRKSRKRIRNPSNWKQNVAKILRNTGKAYVSCTTKKEVSARVIKDACKCRLKCPENVVDADRKTLFDKYWSLGNIELQRSFIRNCMMEIKPKYKYSNSAKPRLPNNAFYFTINNTRIRVCKTFFINTLGICDRQIRTVKKKTDPQGFLTTDIRGKHVSRQPIDPALIENIKQHINSIPRIESHYLRAATTREYISGDRTLTDIWKDFDKIQKQEGKPSCDYWIYYEIFTKQFNISFFQPKKDRCDLCLDYEVATVDQKTKIKDKYDEHLKEKNLCRQEKRLDRQNINDTFICSVYDLQAVTQCPTGDISSFFYKSKLNCLNFTIVELMAKKSEIPKKRKINEEYNENDIGAYSDVYSYFWDEVQGNRGANEIGSCILDYLNNLNEQNPNKNLHVTFYSDNCCGQNKNKFIITLYSYAVTHFENIETISHKYFIKGHSQNEGDNVHSLIEKEVKKNKKGGPIYAPYQYVTLIKNARKNGKPFTVKELTYEFFTNLKALQELWGYNFNEDDDKNNVILNDVKVLQFNKAEPFIFSYKTSYSQSEFKKVNIRNKRKKMMSPEEITVTKAFSQRLELSERKKKDLRDLINKNLIPSYYADFYNSIL
ncbi:unnamed protein product [Parnassius mnemosyne]|uniref:DUF7869 domain-containing protein n=1 Tax=Parnassius mnemosyne TaxID=213953 RepID=A0AAV1M2A6_9NEOP